MLMLRNEMEMTSAEQSPESRCWATMRGGHRLVLVVQTCKHYLVTVLHLTLIVTIIIVTSWGVIVVFTPSLTRTRPRPDTPARVCDDGTDPVSQVARVQ